MFMYDTFIEDLSFIFNPEELISAGGLLVIFLAVYAQTGLFITFFVPSGVFLFTGGVFISTGKLDYDLFPACVCMVTACVAGCSTGYWFGRKTGAILYEKKDSRFFKQKHLESANAFYKKYGQYALTIGMLFPIIRTFSPIVAGVIKMNFGRFLLLVSIGSVIWVVPFILAGYLVGNIPILKEYFPYIIIAFLVAVTTPIVLKILNEFKKQKKT
jgi:membrane-associated protein